MQFISFVLMCYVLPVLCLAGVCLNITCIYIFSAAQRTTVKNSLQVYLVALCMFDTMQLFLSLLILPLQTLEQHLRENGAEAHDIVSQCAAYMVPILVPWLLSASAASVWTMTSITVQRFVAICKPLQAHTKPVRLHHIRVTILGISVLAVLINLPQFLKWRLDADLETNVTMFHLTDISMHDAFRYVEYGMHLIMIYLVPGLILTALNLKMARVIARTKHLERHLSTRHNYERRAAFMTGVVVVAFFLLHTLSMYSYIVNLVHPDLWIYENYSWLINDLNNLAVNFNSCLNPVIFFLFTRRFKDLLSANVKIQSFRLMLSKSQSPRVGSSKTNLCIPKPKWYDATIFSKHQMPT